MKIRAGFVSNSSSTSFLVISQRELSEADLMSLMGVEKKSPLAGLFVQLFRDLLEQTDTHVDFSKTEPDLPAETWFTSDRMSDRMIEKLREAKDKGLHAYYGQLSSDNNNVQTFFCTDSFELENESMYFNGLECVW